MCFPDLRHPAPPGIFATAAAWVSQASLGLLVAAVFMQPLPALTGDPAAGIRFQSLGSYGAAHPGATVYVENFDDALGTSAPESGTGTPFPRGWYGTFAAKAGTLGTLLEFTAKTNTWCQKGDGIRNIASRVLYDSKPTANANNQNTYLNRALGCTTKSGLGEAYTGTGSAAFGLNLKTIGYTLSGLRFDFTSFSILDTKVVAPLVIGDPVPVGVMLNWSVQVANNPAGPWATIRTITHATQLGGPTPGGVFTHRVDIPNVVSAVAATGVSVTVNNHLTVYFRVVTTSSTTASGTARASFCIDNFELDYGMIPGFVYNGEDDLIIDPDARFDYIQRFNGLDATPLNAAPWSQGWVNDGNPGNRYGLKGWFMTTTSGGVPVNRYLSGNGYIYTFERANAGVVGYDAQDNVIYDATGGPPAVVSYGGVSGADNIANRNIGFRFSHEGAKNISEAFYLGYVYTNNTGKPVTSVEAEFYVPYWQRMGTPAWVRLDFSYKNLGPNFNPGAFRLHEVTGTTLVDATDAQGRHTGHSYLQFEHKGGLSSGTSYPKNDSQSWTLYGQNMSAEKAGIFALSTPLQPGESLLLRWSTQGNGIDYGAHIVAVDNVKLRFITADVPPVNLPPTIQTAPASQSVLAGDNVILGVAASGTAPLSYQWRKNDIDIAGATADTFVLGSVLAADAGSYTVVVSNTAGSVTSAAAQLTVGPASFASWQAENFTSAELVNPALSGPGAVLTADGLSNLLKYALGLNPHAIATTGLPVLSTDQINWLFSYTRPVGRADVTYAVEVSTNLSSWSSAGVAHEMVSTVGDWENWQGRYPAITSPRAFFRLRVGL